jgi:Protein of unknown function (DUF5672)
MAIGITCIDTLHYKPTIDALKTTLKTLGDKITRVYWFSDVDFPEDVGVPVTWVVIPKITHYHNDYSHVTLKLCPEVCKEEHNLIIHADGFAVNADAWTDEFLEQDYIGARWGDGFVGNGGFCLRSRKLYDAFIDMDIKNRPEHYQDYMFSDFYFVVDDKGEKLIPEDNIICKIHKNTLINNYGIKFAKAQLADRFSIEHNYSSAWLGKSLGFHGKHGVANYYGVKL